MLGRGGFAIPVVVFLLFAIGVAAAAAYRVIQSEAQLAVYAEDASQVLAIAQGGLWRRMATLAANPADTVAYSIADGTATVYGRRVYNLSFPQETWVLTSSGSYSDPRYAATPAERTVRQQVSYKRSPVNLLGTFANTGTISVSGGTISGTDAAGSGVCTGSPRSAISATYAPTVGRTAQDVLNSLDAVWSVLTDPSTPADYTNTLPPSGLAYYPIVRYTGDLSITSGFDLTQRQGILIVTGRLTITAPFFWNGIILAGSLGSPMGNGFFVLRGIMAGGFSGIHTNVSFTSGSLQYHSCHMQSAGARVAMLRPLKGTWMEVVDR